MTNETKAYSSIDGFIDSVAIKSTDSHVVGFKRGKLCFAWDTHTATEKRFDNEMQLKNHLKFRREADQVA